jgi:hypothetical protein
VKAFFSDEKAEARPAGIKRLLILRRFPAIRPWPGSVRRRRNQKSFGSFLQKRTLFPATLS